MSEQKISKTACSLNVVLALAESQYYFRWHPHIGRMIGLPRERRHEKPKRPKIIKACSVISSHPTYWHRVDKTLKFEPLFPRVSDEPIKFLRPTDSKALLPNSYLFCGQIMAIDRYYLQSQKDDPSRQMHIKFIVDCSVPLLFWGKYSAGSSGGFTKPFGDTKLGTYIAGLTHLHEDYIDIEVSTIKEYVDTGLFQPVSGIVKKMQVLGLSPQEEFFGRVKSVPFGYKLCLDPDVIRQSFVFMTLEITEIGKAQYKPFPNRDSESPEPEFLEG